MTASEAQIHDIPGTLDVPAGGGLTELTLMLPQATTKVSVTVRGGGSCPLGRAEALFGTKSWAAAHYWAEPTAQGTRMIFEWSEALPAGSLRLRLPHSA